MEYRLLIHLNISEYFTLQFVKKKSKKISIGPQHYTKEPFLTKVEINCPSEHSIVYLNQC